jgi:hypothetical protein
VATAPESPGVLRSALSLGSRSRHELVVDGTCCGRHVFEPAVVVFRRPAIARPGRASPAGRGRVEAVNWPA